jgi:hypothetical protein
MAKTLTDYARDDSVVKLVFDHLRNFGLVALVASAAAWKWKHVSESWGAVWDYVLVAVLAASAFTLSYLNYENLLHKVRSSNSPRWIKALFGVLYALAVGELLRYIQAGRAG